MTQKELRNALIDLEVRPDAYYFGGGAPHEAYVLERQGSVWFVYYSERGVRTGEKRFDSEDEACQYMLRLVEGDLTTRAQK